MDLSTEAVLLPAYRYRLPALLQDIRLLDLLEISGTSLEVSRLCGISQPTISRRTRVLTDDFALEVNRRRQVGCCYGTSFAIQLLRLGCRAHRLAAGVARLGADVLLQPLLAECHWLLPSPPRFRPVASWLVLVRQGVLEPSHCWKGLQRLPLPTPLQLPLWLVLPAEWQEHPVLRHTARELGRLGNRQAEKDAPGA